MATVQKFGDLQVWQLARELSQRIYPPTFLAPIAADFRYKDQIRGSCGSITDNVAEGFERGSKREFIHSLTVAKGEVGEPKSQLYRGRDNQYFAPALFDELYEMADRLTKMLNLLYQLPKPANHQWAKDQGKTLTPKPPPTTNPQTSHGLSCALNHRSGSSLLLAVR